MSVMKRAAALITAALTVGAVTVAPAAGAASTPVVQHYFFDNETSPLTPGGVLVLQWSVFNGTAGDHGANVIGAALLKCEYKDDVAYSHCIAYLYLDRDDSSITFRRQDVNIAATSAVMHSDELSGDFSGFEHATLRYTGASDTAGNVELALNK